MNLVLIGYRGTGKSSVAGLLAADLGLPVLGMDAEIVRRAGTSINDLVAAQGWDAFRDLESEVVCDFTARDDAILDCGGGIVVRPDNVTALKATGVLYWLRAPVDLIAARLVGATDRPALTAGQSFLEEIAAVLAVRTPLYAAAADRTIDLDDGGSTTAARAIAADWRRRG